jgi:hypothetical protein
LNVLISALIEIGILCFSSEISRPQGIGWHRNVFFEKSHIVGGICKGTWDAEFHEACQEDLEQYGWVCRHFLPRYCPLIWTIELRVNFIGSVGSLS